MTQMQLDHDLIAYGLGLNSLLQYGMPLLIIDFYQVRSVQSPLVFRISQP